jgi:hypothetical protein
VSAPHGNRRGSFVSRDGDCELKLSLPFKGFDLASSHGFDVGVSN